MSDKSDLLAELVAADATIRQQAKEIEQLKREVIERQETFGPLLTEAADEIERLRKEVAELRAATGRHWISVADRLPSEGEWCWVHGASFSGPAPAMYDVAVGWTNTDTWEDFDGEVERWFPIAQPPATEGGE